MTAFRLVKMTKLSCRPGKQVSTPPGAGQVCSPVVRAASLPSSPGTVRISQHWSKATITGQILGSASYRNLASTLSPSLSLLLGDSIRLRRVKRKRPDLKLKETLTKFASCSAPLIIKGSWRDGSCSEVEWRTLLRRFQCKVDNKVFKISQIEWRSNAHLLLLILIAICQGIG